MPDAPDTIKKYRVAWPSAQVPDTELSTGVTPQAPHGFFAVTVDPLHASVFLAPLSLYFLLLGLVYLRRRALVISGAKDLGLLGMAVLGFVVGGPMELFWPERAAFRYGWVVWLLLLAFYGLCLTMTVLLARPKLVIYNVTLKTLRPVLASVVARLDPEARWAGDSLCLPSLGVQLHVEPSPTSRHAQLTATGSQQSYQGWRHLELTLKQALREFPESRHPQGAVYVGIAFAMFALITYLTVGNPNTVADLYEMLRIGT